MFIRITDDGAGLDTEAIRAKAIEKGMISPEAALSERELYALILAPGFSTAKEVTNVSGRGVGMDVVKKGIDALQGAIEITSQQGTGTHHHPQAAPDHGDHRRPAGEDRRRPISSCRSRPSRSASS